MVGIIAAMKIEADLLASKMKDKKNENISGIDFVSGKLGKENVVLAICGIGKVFAAICTQTMILCYHPDLIINTGVAGSLSLDLTVYNIAIAEAVVQHDMDTTPIGDPKGLISGINLVRIPSDQSISEHLLRISEENGIKCKKGIIATGDVFVATQSQKDAIVKEFGAIACEMEGGSVGHVCYVNHVPFAVIRAISDSADGDSGVDYPTFVQNAANRSAAILISFLCG